MTGLPRKPHSEKTIEKMIESNKKSHNTEEYLLNNSGENHSRFGKSHTKESLEKMRKPRSELAKINIKENQPDRSGIRNSQAKPIMCIETEKKYSSCTEAQKEFTIFSTPVIRNQIQGKIDNAFGYHWKFITKEEFLNE
jgi:hypothetical protein